MEDGAISAGFDYITEQATMAGESQGLKKCHTGCLPEERAKILELAKDDTYVDLSHRKLSVVASEKAQVEASASSFYRVMKQEQLMER